MYDYANRDLFYIDGTHKSYIIAIAPEDEEGETITLTNSDLEEESFELFDSIMNANSLTFANCISCYVRFTTYYTESIIGRVIAIYEVVEDDTENPIPIGFYTVEEDNISDDGRTRKVIAYDQMYDIINTEVTDWYNGLNFPITIKDFRDSLFEEFGLEQDNEVLINDDISIPKQLSENEVITGGAIVRAIAEMNGVFPHIGKEGILNWITLGTGNPWSDPLYPSLTTYPGETTYPGGGYACNIFDIYKSYHQENSVVWGNYETLKPDGIQIRNEYSEIAYQTNPGAENPYTVISNFLMYGLTNGQYQTIASRLFQKIKDITYTPFTQTKMGDPCLEVGDRVVAYVEDDKEFVSYIFTKHTKGILVPFEDITTYGTLYLQQYEVGRRSGSNALAKKVKNLDNRVGNIEKSGSGPLQIVSVPAEPENPQLNVLYLIQGEVTVT